MAALPLRAIVSLLWGISYVGNRYSVPAEYVGKDVAVVVLIKGESYHLKERKEFVRQKHPIINTLFEQGNT